MANCEALTTSRQENSEDIHRVRANNQIHLKKVPPQKNRSETRMMSPGFTFVVSSAGNSTSFEAPFRRI